MATLLMDHHHHHHHHLLQVHPQQNLPQPHQNIHHPRRPKKCKNGQKKQPQRGLGVAQLEKLRMQEESKKDFALFAAAAAAHPPLGSSGATNFYPPHFAAAAATTGFPNVAAMGGLKANAGDFFDNANKFMLVNGGAAHLLLTAAAANANAASSSSRKVLQQQQPTDSSSCKSGISCDAGGGAAHHGGGGGGASAHLNKSPSPSSPAEDHHQDFFDQARKRARPSTPDSSPKRMHLHHQHPMNNAAKLGGVSSFRHSPDVELFDPSFRARRIHGDSREWLGVYTTIPEITELSSFQIPGNTSQALSSAAANTRAGDMNYVPWPRTGYHSGDNNNNNNNKMINLASSADTCNKATAAAAKAAAHYTTGSVMHALHSNSSSSPVCFSPCSSWQENPSTSMFAALKDSCSSSFGNHNMKSNNNRTTSSSKCDFLELRLSTANGGGGSSSSNTVADDAAKFILEASGESDDSTMVHPVRRHHLDLSLKVAAPCYDHEPQLDLKLAL